MIPLQFLVFTGLSNNIWNPILFRITLLIYTRLGEVRPHIMKLTKVTTTITRITDTKVWVMMIKVISKQLISCFQQLLLIFLRISKLLSRFTEQRFISFCMLLVTLIMTRPQLLGVCIKHIRMIKITINSIPSCFTEGLLISKSTHLQQFYLLLKLHKNQIFKSISYQYITQIYISESQKCDWVLILLIEGMFEFIGTVDGFWRLDILLLSQRQFKHSRDKYIEHGHQLMEQITKPYFFIHTDHDFYIRTQGDTFPKKLAISINRLTSKIQQMTPEQFEAHTYNISAKNSETVYLIIGVITILQQPYLCLVTNCEPVGTFMDDTVYLIRNVKFVPFKHKFLYSSIDQTEAQKIIDGLRTGILADNFYFCYHQDITLTYGKQYTSSRRPTQRKYFWNQDLLRIFSRHKLSLAWRIPIMQGYVAEIKQKTNFFPYSYLNISRRSKYMSGTRFNSRGIDHSFNAANFVETEEVFSCHHYIFSHVSLRGSAPLFWSQSGFGAQIKFSKQKEEENQFMMAKHFELLEHEYSGDIVAINLLSKNKSPEKQLRNRYQFYYYKNVKGHYLYFDLNEEVSSKKDNAHTVIEGFINKNMQLLAGQGNFFCIDTRNRKIICQQKLIPRINCLDCIDRTNVIMARISELYLKQVEFFINAHCRQPHEKLELSRQFDSQLLENWAQLGNKISQIYCGTESVASHLTKKQNNSFFSFFSSSIKSINRYYNANMSDSAKQQCMDYLLNNKEERSSSMQYFEDNITNQILKTQELKYCTHQEYGIHIITWNCNMVDPTVLQEKDLNKLFNFSRNDVDIVIVCLQEMVQLNSYNVILGNNQTITQIWRKTLYQHINKQSNHGHPDHSLHSNRGIKKQFDYLTGYDLVGISTFIFVNKKIIEKIHQMEWFQIKTGFKGSLGNKGAIILFFCLDSTPITLINCHLAAGQAKSSERIQDIDYIHRDAIKDRSKRRFFDRSQFRFFVGDFNFRVEAKNQSTRQLLYSIQKQDINQKLNKQELGIQLSRLLEKDEYRMNCTSGSLSLYVEPEICFFPTYKYVKKEKQYDIKRTPSWCDRILFHCKQKLKITPLRYSDVDIYLSDHKPVSGTYKFLCKLEDRDQKKKLIQMYYDS